MLIVNVQKTDFISAKRICKVNESFNEMELFIWQREMIVFAMNDQLRIRVAPVPSLHILFCVTVKIYGDQRLTRERKKERKNGTLSWIIWERGTKSGSAATYKAVVGAERANRRSNLFAQRSGALDANGYSSRRRSEPASSSYSSRWPASSTLHNRTSPFPVVPSPPSPSLNHHLWG